MSIRKVFAYVVAGFSAASALRASPSLHDTPEQRIHRNAHMDVTSSLDPPRVPRVMFAHSGATDSAAGQQVRFDSRCVDCDQLRPVIYERGTLMNLLESGADILAHCPGCAVEWTVERSARVELIRALGHV